MDNRYLRDRATRRMDRASGHDRTSSYRMKISGERDNRGRSGKSYGNYYDNYDEKDYDYYERDYNHQEEFHGGRLSQDYASMKNEYEEDLKRWISRLKRKTNSQYSMKDIIEQAKQMGARFDEYNEDEFYAVYLAKLSDYPFLGSEPKVYIKMAKAFFEDDDIEVSPSEKLCIYFYKIVKGEE